MSDLRWKPFGVAFALALPLSYSTGSDAYLRMAGGACHVEGGKRGSLGGGTIGTQWDEGDVTVSCPVVVPEPSVFHQFNLHYTDGNPNKAFRANACVTFFSRVGGACFGEFSTDPPSLVTRPHIGATIDVQAMPYPRFNTWENNPADFPFVSVIIPAAEFKSGVRQDSSVGSPGTELEFAL